MNSLRTKNDMNIKLIPAPRKVVLNAGTYHGMFAYCPVQPNQKVLRHASVSSRASSLLLRVRARPRALV